MSKKIFIALVVVGVLVFLVRRSGLLSYAGVFWCQVTQEAKKQVPTKFEIERARREIAAMEGDISNMLHPIAEHMAAIKKLKKTIQTTRTSLAEQKENILTMTRDLEGDPAVLYYGGEEYNAERVRKKLQRDFAGYKRCESHLKSQEKLLEAKEKSFAAAREQLAKLLTKKQEYEVRLAQLEADEETLHIARIGSKLPSNDNRASTIEGILADIENRQEVQRAEVELLNGPSANDFIPVQNRTSGKTATLDDIRNYFGVAPAPKTASKK